MPDLAQLNEPFELSARSDVDHAYMVECRGSGPVAAVQSPVLDGFGQVGNGKLVGSIKVSYRARNLEDTVVGSGGEALLLHGPLAGVRSRHRVRSGRESGVWTSARWRRCDRRPF